MRAQQSHRPERERWGEEREMGRKKEEENNSDSEWTWLWNVESSRAKPNNRIPFVHFSSEKSGPDVAQGS